jgi:hypothetical protein
MQELEVTISGVRDISLDWPMFGGRMMEERFAMVANCMKGVN